MVKTIILSFLAVLLFFGCLIAFGWLDTGDQTHYQVLFNIFAGNYLFFTIPVFLLAFFVLSGGSGFRSLVVRYLIILILAVAGYYAISTYLISKLNG